MRKSFVVGTVGAVVALLGLTAVAAHARGSTGSITGTLTDSSSSPLAGICADAVGGANVSSPPSDSAGTFVIAGLPSGTYKVQFYDCANGGNWATQWYDNQLQESSAHPVSVIAGHVTRHIDDELVHAGSISGTVTDTQGHPLSGVCVDMAGSSSLAITNSNGNYTLAELNSGTYRVAFDELCGPLQYIPQYYDGASNSADATPVTVTFGQDTAGIDARLVLGGKLSGTVTLPSGGPAVRTCIQASDGGGHTYNSSVWYGGGSYTIGPVVPGTYTVQFSDCAPTPSYQTQWYNREAAAAAANAVTVVGGQDATGIDATMGAPLVPFVSSISPGHGPAAGGTQVTISGAGLVGATSVHFGNRSATSYKVVSDNQITATAPPGQVGAVDVTVTGPGGISAPNATDRFTYTPTVTSVTPSSGAAGAVVMVSGSQLSQAQIFFGTRSARVTTVLSDGSLLVQVPGPGAGTVDVIAVVSGINSPTVPGDRFTYLV